jgi:2-phosphosulfolactate phosphatase
MEDTLFAGALIERIKEHYSINCDSSQIADTLYTVAKEDLFQFMKSKDASHFHRLIGFGLERDIRYCLSPDVANVLPFYETGKLNIHKW